jgi:hypothetical protein
MYSEVGAVGTGFALLCNLQFLVCLMTQVTWLVNVTVYKTLTEYEDTVTVIK